MTALPINNKFMRQRLIPYRVLAILLFGQGNQILSVSNNKVRIESGPMSRALRIPISRLVESLKWLEVNKFIKAYNKISMGIYEVELLKPRNISE